MPNNDKYLEISESVKKLRELMESQDIDLSLEINNLEKKINRKAKKIEVENPSWDVVQLARLSTRPTSLEYIGLIFDDFLELHGDRNFKDDKAVVGGIAYLDGKPVTVIGHQKGRDTKENIERNFGMAYPEGYRKSLRLMKQAEKFGRPIICFIDTPGAYCGIGAEERGQGEAIAMNLMEMSTLEVPVICIVIGEGGSGGALAFGIGDRVWMLENTIYSVLSPEGFASILWKDASRAKEASAVMKITAKDLSEFGIIDEVIKENAGGAHEDVHFVANLLKEKMICELEEISKLTNADMLEKRYEKYRKIGTFNA